MLFARSRYLWFMVVSIIYVLLVFVLHRNLHRFNVPDISTDVTDVEGRQWIVDDNSTSVDEPPSLAFPVIHPCVGASVGPPSGLLPLGPDWFYTAYFDDRLKVSASSVSGETYIRVLALLRRRVDFDRRPFFYFRWPQSETGNTTTRLAEMYEMCENHGRRYGGWILSTRFAGRLPPCSIAVTHGLTRAAEVRLPVFRMSGDELAPTVDGENKFWLAGMSLLRGLAGGGVTKVEVAKPRGKFAVCVPPLYGAITPSTLVQFVELTRLLGAQHFVFYVSGVSESLRRVLDAYQADDVVTAIPWVLPGAAAQSIWYNGQLLAANDCLYRTSHAFQFVAFNDVDEFIVPHSTTDWSMMLAELAKVVDRKSQPGERDDEETSQPGSVITNKLLLPTFIF